MVGCVSGSGNYELHVTLSNTDPKLPGSGITHYSTLEDARQAMEAAKSKLVAFGATRVNRSVVLLPGTQARAEYLLRHEPSQSKSRVLDRLKAFFAPVTDAMKALFHRFFGKEPAMASREPAGTDGKDHSGSCENELYSRTYSEPAASSMGNRPLPEILADSALCVDHLVSRENDLYSSIDKLPVMARSTSTSDLTSSVEEDLHKSFEWESDGPEATSMDSVACVTDRNFVAANTLVSDLDAELAEIQQNLSTVSDLDAELAEIEQNLSTRLQQASGKLNTVSLSSTESIFTQGLTVEPEGVDDYLNQLDERLKFQPQVAQGLETDTAQSSLAAVLLEKMREFDAPSARLIQAQEAVIKGREQEEALSKQFAELVNSARKLV